MLRPSPNHGTLRLPNDDNDDPVMAWAQALIQDQISTSPSPRAVDAQRGRRTNIITYIINKITFKGNYKPNLLAFLLQNHKS